MSDGKSSRRYQILTLLLENRAGLSIDEISQKLDISRTAVQQHFSTLERDGYIQAGRLNKTAGRPVRTFTLTEAGLNRFPKQYAWFSELMLADLKETMGAEAFQEYLHKLGHSLSQKLLPRFQGKQGDECTKELATIMDELGFQTTITQDPNNEGIAIEACNCIYHDLAQKHVEICEFDRTLMSSLLGKNIDHVECMATGGAICKFKVINKTGQK